MAIFGFGKKDDKPAAKAGPAVADTGFNSEKARRFFDQARTVHNTDNFEYAMQMWLAGLALDPNDVPATEGFFQSAQRFIETPDGKKGPGKEVRKVIQGKGAIEEYLVALLEWSVKFTDPVLAVRASEQSAKLGFKAPGRWMAEIAYKLVKADKKGRKDLLLKMKDCFSKLDEPEKALRAAEAAMTLDPTDGNLQAEIRSLAAASTMARGGYDKAGQAGGFRANIRDADKQRQLEASDRISKTEDDKKLAVKAAEEDYLKRPTDIGAIDKYTRTLLERGEAGDADKAHDVYMKAYTETGQFKFRQAAGDIRMRQGRGKLRAVKEKLDAAPADAALQQAFKDEEARQLKLEIAEFKSRVEAYPTDLGVKYELGRRLFLAQEHGEAIALFQESRSDPKFRAGSLNMLGQSFSAIDWIDESVQTFREALESKDLTSESEMELRYNLMASLQRKAEASRDLPAAEEAERIASSIAIKNFNYRDIRARRDTLKKLITELKAPK